MQKNESNLSILKSCFYGDGNDLLEREPEYRRQSGTNQISGNGNRETRKDHPAGHQFHDIPVGVYSKLKPIMNRYGSPYELQRFHVAFTNLL